MRFIFFGLLILRLVVIIYPSSISLYVYFLYFVDSEIGYNHFSFPISLYDLLLNGCVNRTKLYEIELIIQLGPYCKIENCFRM